MRYIFFLLFTNLLFTAGYCQGTIDRFTIYDSLLAAKIIEIPALDEKVTISVSNVPLEEFMRGVANSSGLNLDVQPGLNFQVVNNFSNVKVRDMLVYLCRQFNLDLEIVGNIISIVKLSDDEVRNSQIKWDEVSQLISFDFRDMPIEKATREITQATQSNIVLSPGLFGERINAYIQSSPLKNAIEKMAYANGMELQETDDKFYVLSKKVVVEPEMQPDSRNRRNTNTSSSRSQGNRSQGYQLEILKNDSINLSAENTSITDILMDLFEKTGKSYFLSPKVEGEITVNIKNASLDQVLSNIFSGGQNSFRSSGGIYLIGERNSFDFSEHRVIQLQNRSIEKIIEFIPEDISKNLAIKEFPELNSLLVSGAAYQIDEFENFVYQIDKVVPVILIEVIIMYVNKSTGVATGISAALGDKPVETQGTFLPSLDVTIGASKINQVINDMGWVNLGKVTPNFYVSLQAMETQGLIELESTPKLSTLNGHEASLSIGNTEYYLEEQANMYGSLNPQLTTTQIYKAVNAELSVKIKPVVSGDEQITLEIEVSQSDFTERISKTAPPGTVNREFTSEIRIKNEEMVLLGGLLEKRKSESSTGIPLLSRIPIIKWFFSSRKHDKSDSKLTILVKSTIIN